MMKQNPIPLLTLCLVLVFLFLFPATLSGRSAADSLFPKGNLGEEELLTASADQENGNPDAEAIETAPSPVSASPEPETAFTSELKDVLPGHYVLVTVHTGEDEYSEDLLSQLHQLGIPLELLLDPDGTAVYAVFDQAVALTYDADRMQIAMNERTLPFFYQDGILRIQDGENYLCFEKQG